MSDYEMLRGSLTLTIRSLAGGLFGKESDKKDGRCRCDYSCPADPCLRRGAGEGAWKNRGDPKR